MVSYKPWRDLHTYINVNTAYLWLVMILEDSLFLLIYSLINIHYFMIRQRNKSLLLLTG